ncbi:MAG: GNAT family N-acetyltransferase [Candidatus Marinimicrobia bacterium]|nr:GNAT family N-acetyltransferase [Candidatus Neomarinimicrobiota bacterium]MCF7829484.1 GNAT family N-acetyltransferase [Candidatus Neomarinimicrobiota bacterium]MCF7880118.1 GNAT family N-acetyltransferase [Candidatus Neomarinimicrobiota bacterium]
MEIAEQETIQATDFKIQVADDSHFHYAEEISNLIEVAAEARGTGISERPPQYIQKKMAQHDAIIATYNDELAGFCYIETWTHGKYVANSGLIVAKQFRGHGLGKKIKQAVFNHSRNKYPEAKVFGITTTPAVMKINSDLGYRPVSFDELTREEEFWDGCQSCPNYDILTRNDRRNCLCTGMLYDPEDERNQEREKQRMKAQKKSDLGGSQKTVRSIFDKLRKNGNGSAKKDN